GGRQKAPHCPPSQQASSRPASQAQTLQSPHRATTGGGGDDLCHPQMPNAADLHPLRRAGEGKSTGAASHDRVQHAPMGGNRRISRPPNTTTTRSGIKAGTASAKTPLSGPYEATRANCATGPQGEKENRVRGGS